MVKMSIIPLAKAEHVSHDSHVYHLTHDLHLTATPLASAEMCLLLTSLCR